MSESVPWRLQGFLEAFDRWIQLEKPADDLRPIVLAWVMSRSQDPYEGVKREVGFDDLWFGIVPNSSDGLGHVVVCSYFIQDGGRIVRCDQFGTLSWPA